MFTLASTAGVPAQSRTVFQAASSADPDKEPKPPVVNAQQASVRVLNSAIETIQFSEAEQERQRRQAEAQAEAKRERVDQNYANDQAFAKDRVDERAVAAEDAQQAKRDKVDVEVNAEAEASENAKKRQEEHIDVFA